MNTIDPNIVICELRKVSIGVSQRIDDLIEEYGEDEISWSQHISEYGGIYEVFKMLANYINRLSNLDSIEIQKIFDLVEEWYIKGDYSVKQAVTIGFLEGLICLNESLALEEELTFSYMGVETKYWAKRVKEFWINGTPINDTRST